MATITNRELKNKSTGIDVLVPDYEEIQGALTNTVMYQIIVITKLFYFKKSQMRESDVVQFMVPRKYGDFEELFYKITQRYPSVTFPPLPRRSLVQTESVIHERRHAMEAVFDVICRTPKLASCPALLQFLGVKSSVIKSTQEGSSSEPVSKEETVSEQKAPMAKMEDEDDDVNLFEDDNERQGGDEDVTAATSTAVSKSASLFDDKVDDTPGVLADTSDLFIPCDAKVEKKGKSDLFIVEDESDLLNIDDDIDKLLQVSKPPPQPKPRPRKDVKPELKPKPAAMQSMFDETNSEMDELFSLTSTEKPLKPAKPAALRPKPSPPGHKPKPIPKPRQSSRTDTEVSELFAEVKKMPMKRENAPEELETLDDIFGDLSDESPTKPVFSGLDGDDSDLFAPLKSPNSLTTDDISQYIQQNQDQGEVTLDL